MGRARAEHELPGSVSAAEALWYDASRWPTFVDGFAHVVKVEGDWPRTGARVVWDSVRSGRGRVSERVTAYEVRRGQTVEVEDPRIVGTQTVTFTALEVHRCTIALELAWRLKQGGPAGPVIDALFVTRSFRDALRRTVARFARELQAERELDG